MINDCMLVLMTTIGLWVGLQQDSWLYDGEHDTYT